MNNNVQVNLQFTANTAQAKQELANLQTQLTSLINQPVPIGAKMTADIQKATAAAAELKVHLQNATNVKTGMLDFGKLNQSIKQSGMSLSQYGAQLQSLGAQGQQAFMQLANSVAAAEVPIRRASGALTGMMTTFKNTAKWMVSSTVLNGFINTMSSAYNYAQDLNESLNNIRIVTGHNIDQMAKFAAEANKAAKALSATTTEYTNASLIYYQQGLSDQQVKERTDVTIKMANVSRQSAEVVSDQMTAVWNNFYDGSKSLESYADALTALGAATATSTDEIAQGLEKFAAIADTVGLSYEYATAALATVTAQTRQSADVVGTAFKTLFARIQDLKLGETLEDGTTLGQYSEALNKVGINIKTANGDLKDMDDILNEMGAKWKTLERDEQAALAKAVGGLRQYNQIIALMDNWDFMQKNLTVVENSTGTLQKQADVYAESWEAASKRVKASAEKVYSTLLNDKFFVELNNGFADFLDTLGSVMKGMGGLKGLLSTLGVIMTKVFATQMAQGFRNAAHNLKMMTAAGRAAVQQAKESEMQALHNQMTSYKASGLSDQVAQDVYSQQLKTQTEIVAKADQLSETEKIIAQTLLDQGKAMGEVAIQEAKRLESANAKKSDLATKLMSSAYQNTGSVDNMANSLSKVSEKAKQVGDATASLDILAQKGKISSEEMSRLATALEAAGYNDEAFSAEIGELQRLAKSGGDTSQILERLKAVLQGSVNNTIDDELNNLKTSGDIVDTQIKEVTMDLQNYATAAADSAEHTRKYKGQLDNVTQSGENVSSVLKKAKGNTLDWANGLTSIASGLMSIGMLVSSINGMIDTLSNPDTTGWEKFSAILTSVGMIAMSTMSIIGAVGTAKIAFTKKDTEATNENTAANIANAQSENLGQKEDLESAGMQGVKTKATIRNTRTTQRGTIYNRIQTKDGKNILTRQTKQGEIKAFSLGAKSLGGTIAGVAAGIAIAAVSIHLMSEALNKHNKEAVQAAESAARLSQSYEEARGAYDTFINTLDSYKSAKENIAGLTEGTLEYKQAVLDANAEALKLLETNKELTYTIGKDGLIEIGQESLEKAQEQQLNELQAKQSAALLGRRKADEAEVEAKSIEFRRKYAKGDSGLDGEGDTAQIAGTAAAAAGIGAAIGSIIPIVGNTLGAVIGGLVGSLAGVIGGAIWAENDNDATEQEQKALETLVQAYQKEGDSVLTYQGIEKSLKDLDDGELRQSLLANVDATADMVVAQAQLQESLDANTRAILTSAGIDTDVAWTGTELLNEQIEVNTTELEKIFKANVTRVSDYDTNKTVKDIADRYAKALNKNINWNIDDTIVKQDGEYYLQYQEIIDGKLGNKLIAVADAFTTIVSSESVRNIEWKLEEAESVIDAAEDKLGENFVNNVIAAVGSSQGAFGEELTQENLETILSLGNDTEAIKAFLSNNLGINFNEFLNSLKKDETAFLDNWIKYTEGAKNELETTLISLVPELRSSFELLINNGNFAQTTGKDKMSIVEALNDIYYNEGPELAEQFMSYLSNMDSETLAAFGKTISTSGLRASSEEFSTSFKAVAEDMDISNSAVEDFLATWITFSQQFVTSMDSVISYIAQLKNISLGEAVTEEQIKALTGLTIEQAIKQGAVAQYGSQHIWQGDQNELIKKHQQGLLTNAQSQSNTLNSYSNLTYNENYAGTSAGLYTDNKTAADYSKAADEDLERIVEQLNEGVGTNGWYWSKDNPNSRHRYTLVDNENQTSPYAPSQMIAIEYQSSSRTGGWGSSYYATDPSKNLVVGALYGQRPDNWYDNHTFKQNSSSLPTTEITPVLASYGGYSQATYYDTNGQQYTQGITPYAQDAEKTHEKSYTHIGIIKTKLDFLRAIGGTEKLSIEKINQLTDAFIHGAEITKDEVELVDSEYKYFSEGKFETLINETREKAKATWDAYINSLIETEDYDTIAAIANNQSGSYDIVARQAAMEGVEALNVQGKQFLLGDEALEYNTYLQDTAKLSSMIADDLEGINLQAVTNSIIGMKQGINELYDQDIPDLFDILYGNGKLSKLDPRYEEASNTLNTMLSKLLRLSPEEIDYIGIFSDGIYQQLLISLQEGSITYEQFLTQIGQGILSKFLPQEQAKDYISNIAILSEGFTELGQTIKLDEETGEGWKNLITQLEAAGMSIATISSLLSIMGQKINTIIDPETGKTIVESVTNLGSGMFDYFQKMFDTTKKKQQSSIPDKKDGIFERYKEINEAIEDNQRLLERTNKEADRLYGVGRLKKMQEANKILKDEIGLNEEKLRQTEEYLKQDEKRLQEAGKAVGVKFDIDPKTGNINNAEEVMQGLDDYYTKAYENAIKDGKVTEKEEERLEDIDTKRQNVKDAIDQYDETNEQRKTLQEDIQNDKWEEQDNNAEILTATLELRLEINEDDLKDIEHKIAMLGEENIYNAAELAGLKNNQGTEYVENINVYQQHYEQLKKDYKDGKISDADYAEGLKKVKAGLQENTENLKALDQEMMDYYGNTLQMAQEELDKYNSKIEHSANVLDHYSSIMSLMGKDQDYETMGTILEGQASVAADKAQVARDTYDMYTQQVAEKQALVDNARTDAERELYQKELDAALEYQAQAEEEMLASTEEWLEAEKNKIENELNKFAKDLENSLTDGMGFDYLTETMDRARSLQEEFLTTTNKVYETNKLIANVQKDIDKTTNTAAKRRLKEFADETKHLQNKEKLSNFELKHQQAKYDLLLAEIALEEAQNAKSTVRLQRDSEGNFGYVYTADQNAVADAEMNYAEKENALYNLRLEEANKQAEIRFQLEQESYEALTQLALDYQNGIITSEDEYNRRREDIINYYNQIFMDNGDIYAAAIGEDARVAQDAWTSAFVGENGVVTPESMSGRTAEWQRNVDTYSQQASKALERWQSVIDDIAKKTGLDNLATKVNNVTTAANNLATKVSTEVTPKMTTLLTEVSKQTSAWAAFREKLVGKGGFCEAAQQTADDIDEDITKLGELDKVDPSIEIDYNFAEENKIDTLQKKLDKLDKTDPVITITTKYVTKGNGDKDILEGDDDKDTIPKVLYSGHSAIGQYVLSSDTTDYHLWKLNDDGSDMGYVDNQTYQSYAFRNSRITAVRKDNSGSGYWAQLDSQNKWLWLDDLNLGPKKGTEPVMLDTGGYTGEWGPEGKLALLHEKELILKPDDTSNFLSALGLLDNILLTLDKYSVNAQLSGLLSSPVFSMNNQDTLEQNVHIEASFPNVSDRNEIEEAFSELINYASQYANRKEIK